MFAAAHLLQRMPKLHIVLVEPREAGNVGAAARVMKNFGCTRMTIVGKHPELDPLAGWWASGAGDVVESSARVPALYDAIGDAHVSVATTSSRGRTTAIDLNPRTLGQLFAELGDDQTLALVFGREDRGLTREEAVMCHRTAVIPTNPEFPVMNLAQSVGVFCYELSQVVAKPKPRELAPAGMVERFHERAQSLLVESGFLWGSNPDHVYDDLRAMLTRADADQRELTILLGIVRQLEWAMRGETK